MSYPKSIKVLVEGDDTEITAVRLWVKSMYDAAEYEDSNGRRFFIDRQYMDECVSKHKSPDIPLRVVTMNEEMREKLERGMRSQYDLKKREESKLILPDGYQDREKLTCVGL